jgi:hypothetical protein
MRPIQGAIRDVEGRPDARLLGSSKRSVSHGSSTSSCRQALESRAQANAAIQHEYRSDAKTDSSTVHNSLHVSPSATQIAPQQCVDEVSDVSSMHGDECETRSVSPLSSSSYSINGATLQFRQEIGVSALSNNCMSTQSSSDPNDSSLHQVPWSLEKVFRPSAGSLDASCKPEGHGDSKSVLSSKDKPLHIHADNSDARSRCSSKHTFPRRSSWSFSPSRKASPELHAEDRSAPNATTLTPSSVGGQRKPPVRQSHKDGTEVSTPGSPVESMFWASGENPVCGPQYDTYFEMRAAERDGSRRRRKNRRRNQRRSRRHYELVYTNPSPSIVAFHLPVYLIHPSHSKST